MSKDLKKFIQQEVTKLHTIDLLKEQKTKIEKQLKVLSEGQDVKKSDEK